MKDSDQSHRFVFLVGGLIFLATFNRILLLLLGQHSHWRAEHSLAGLILLVIYGGLVSEETYSQKRLWRFIWVAIIPTYIGTVFPDIDISLLGIGGHRNPLFHSCLSFWILAAILDGRGQLARYVVIGYGIGLCSHLFLDAFDRAAIRWLPGGLLIDRMWLVGNSLLCLLFPSGGRTKDKLTDKTIVS